MRNHVHSDIQLLFSGTEEINRWVNANPSQSLQLASVRLAESNLPGVLLRSANLTDADFRKCNFASAKFDKANLTRTRFVDCDLRRSSFTQTTLSTIHMTNCLLDGADFRNSRGFSEIHGITTCVVTDHFSDVEFDISYCRLLDKVLSWRTLKAVGQLRLFVPAYGALIISMAILTMLGLLNERLAFVQKLTSDLLNRGLIADSVATALLNVTQPWRPSWRHLAVLISTSGLAIGSTIYLLCPARVREFTIDQWRFTVARPSFEYHIWTWVLPVARVACALFYAIGGFVAAILLGDTLVRLVLLIVTT